MATMASSDFEKRRKRFNIGANSSLKNDIPKSSEILICGFIHNHSLNVKEIPIELILLIYSFYHTLIAHFGFRFYYSPYYKTIKQIPDEEQHTANINDHSGYDITQLYVSKRFDSFKQEIIINKHISMEEFQKLILTKTREIMKTDIAKKQKASRNATKYLHYDIQADSPLSFIHIMSLVLFTDFEEFCVDFKKSFCPLSESDTISNVRARNSCFWWMSKSLRETVELYGASALDYGNQTLSGPFYASSSVPMLCPGFNIRLCVPTSTTVKLEVAKSFAVPKGMVLQFNNKKVRNYLTGYDCSFVSKCKQESEIIFCGGYYGIILENIIMMKTNEDVDLAKYIQSLYVLDCMITGTHLKNVSNDNEKDIIMILQHLFEYKLGKLKAKTLPDYIYLTFAAFTEKKQQIVLNLSALSYFNAKIKPVADLLMYSMDSNVTTVQDDDSTNLFRMELCAVFENVKTIIISTTGYGDKFYPLSLVYLLTLIESTSVERVMIKARSGSKWNRGMEMNWIAKCWMSRSENYKYLYNEKNYNLSLKEIRNDYGETGCMMIIDKVIKQ